MSTIGEAMDGQPVLLVEGKKALVVVEKAINGYPVASADDSRTTHSFSSAQLPHTISEQGVSSRTRPGHC